MNSQPVYNKTIRSSDYLHGLEEHDSMKNTRRIIKDRFRSDGWDSSWKTRRANVEIYLPFDEQNFVPERGKQSRMIYIPAEKQLGAICIIFPFINYSIWPYDRFRIFFVHVYASLCVMGERINFQVLRIQSTIERWDAGIRCYRKHVNRVFRRS